MVRLLPFTPYELHGDFEPMAAALLRSKMEPNVDGGVSLADCSQYFSGLVESGRYVKNDKPCFYIYRHSRPQGQVIGLWGLLEGTALGHEDTLDHKLLQQYQYRQTVGLEGSPVILAHRAHPKLGLLLQGWSMGIPDFSHQLAENIYEFWRVDNPNEIDIIAEMACQLGQLYIADGHHRMATATKTRQPLSVLLFDSGQLQVQGYHRLVRLENSFQSDKLISAIEKFWYRSLIPANKPYLPDRKRRLGMSMGGRWYQLDLKEGVRAPMELSDAQLLQETILSNGLGIHDASSTERLDYYADAEMPGLLEKLAGPARYLAFTLYPIAVEDLLGLAENNVNLPPKSTWIEPRAPYGLLINQLHTNKPIALCGS